MVHLHAHAPVTWPSPEIIARAWPDLAGLTRELTTVAADRQVHVDHAGNGSEPTGQYLTGGEHGRPGASYRTHAPRLTRGGITAAIEADGASRLTYRENARRGAEVAISAPGTVCWVTSRSTLRHLQWELDLRTEIERSATERSAIEPPLRARVLLNWLAVEVSARIDPAGTAPPARSVDAASLAEEPIRDSAPTEGSHRLVAELTIAGRGVWAPVLAGLLSAVRKHIAAGFAEILIEIATDLTSMATDLASMDTDSASMDTDSASAAPGADRSGEETHVQAARSVADEFHAQLHQALVRQLRDRLHRVEDVVSVGGRRARSAASWQREYAQLSALIWPDAPSGANLGKLREEQIVHTVSRARPKRRREVIEVEIAAFSAEIARIEREAADASVPGGPGGRSAPGSSAPGSRTPGSRTLGPAGGPVIDDGHGVSPDAQRAAAEEMSLVEAMDEVLTNERLDLSWLRSPISAVRRAMHMGQDERLQLALERIEGALPDLGP